MSNHVTGITAQTTSKVQPVEKDPVINEIVQEVEKQQKIQTPEKGTVTGELSKHAGLDIGTMGIVSARQIGQNTSFKRIRNVFIDLTQEQVAMLKLGGKTSYVTKNDICYVLGDDAANVANVFGRKLRAPMEKGIISAGELEAMEMLHIMVGEVLGKAPAGGICTVSSPSAPVDNDFDCIYHEAVVKDIVESYGWEVNTSSESTAMAYSEAANSDFTCLATSWGHGMVNSSLVFRSIEVLKFSISRSGSWIDQNAAKVCGKTASQICAIKEKGIDILNPQGKEAQAISIYYKHLISYTIKNFIQKFKEIQGNIELPEEIPLIVAGGTSLPKGFIDLVKQAINKEKGFPFAVSEVRQAQDPLNSIAKGLLVMSQNR